MNTQLSHWLSGFGHAGAGRDGERDIDQPPSGGRQRWAREVSGGEPPCAVKAENNIPAGRNGVIAHENPLANSGRRKQDNGRRQSATGQWTMVNSRPVHRRRRSDGRLSHSDDPAVATKATLVVTTTGTHGVGSFTATCAGAGDRAGNKQLAPVIAKFTVVYGFGGFRSPLPGTTVAKSVHNINVRF